MMQTRGGVSPYALKGSWGISSTGVRAIVDRRFEDRAAFRLQGSRSGLMIDRCVGTSPSIRFRQRTVLCASVPGSPQGDDKDATAPPQDSSPPPSGPASAWPQVLQVPLQMAATISMEDAHYLEKRGRTKWWSKAAFPMVVPEPADDLPPLQTWQKVLPLGLIFFLASFNLTILQNLKDAIMVTTAGAECLPWLSSCVVLPVSLVYFTMYKKIVENFPQQLVFYAAISPLLLFYIFFALVLYPAHGSLHPTGLFETLAALTPAGLHGLIKVVSFWTFSLFFCSAELWGTVVIAVLFWTLANEVCTLEEARSVYPMMGIAANIALVFSGSFVKMVCKATASAGTHTMLCSLVAAVVAGSGAMALTKAAVDKWVVAPYCSLDSAAASGGKKKKKDKGSFTDSIAAMKSSPKVASLAVLVMSYGIAHRLFEFAWKGQVRVLYTTPEAYQGLLADVSIATGYATMGLMILGKFIFQYLGWNAAAMTTPLFMAVAGSGFFLMSLAANQGISVFGMDPLAMAYAGVAAGSLTQIVARSAKFSLFDSSKEMVWIEMPKEEKSKGKAAVDLIGSQFGKSGGAVVTQAALLLTGSIATAMPIISAAYMAVCAAWIGAVTVLGSLIKKYEEEEKEKEAAEEAAKLSSSAPDKIFLVPDSEIKVSEGSA